MSSSIDSKLDQSDHRPWYRRFRVPLVIGVVIVGITLYLLATGFEAEVYRLKLKGEPTSLEECRKYLKLPVDDGAGEHWRKAIEANEKARSIVYAPPSYVERGYDRLPFVGEGDVPRDADAWYADLPTAVDCLTQFEETRSQTIRAIDAGDRIPFSTEYECYRNHEVYDSLSGVMGLWRIIALETLTLIVQDRLDDAVASADRLSQLEKSISRNPLPIAYLIQLNWDKSFDGLLACFLSSSQLTSRQCHRLLQSRFPKAYQQQQIASLLVDRAIDIEYERNESILFHPLAIHRMQHRKAELMWHSKKIELSRNDSPTLFAMIVGNDSFFQRNERMQSLLLSAMLAEARQRLHLAAIASKIFSIERGRVPQSIDELVPDYLENVPLFPATDDRMIMSENDQGELVFSYPVEPASDLTELKIPQFRYQVRPMDHTD